MNFADPWRYRCPEGHATWHTRPNGDYWCERCDEKYPHLVDWKVQKP